MNNINNIIICFLILIVLVIFLKINTTEKFYSPLEENGFNLVNCSKFPYLCSKGNKNLNNSQYPYRQVRSLRDLNSISPRHKRGTSYRSRPIMYQSFAERVRFLFSRFFRR